MVDYRRLCGDSTLENAILHIIIAVWKMNGHECIYIMIMILTVKSNGWYNLLPIQGSNESVGFSGSPNSQHVIFLEVVRARHPFFLVPH